MTTTILRMRVNAPGAELEPARTTPPTPGSGWVNIAVQASGVCFADVATSEAANHAGLPVTPGHEIAGVIEELGEDVAGWNLGDRVAVGWFGGSCGDCEFCRRGDLVHCPKRKIPGLSYPGGWAQSVTVPADALARIPEGLDVFDAAPMGCAGVTTFNAIRRANLPRGSRLAVFGLGGLGHFAVQFAAKMGHEVVAIARGSDREDLAYRLGSTYYIDSTATSPGAALRDLGGADLILSTASTTSHTKELLAGLRVRGRLTVLGVDGGHVEVPVAQLVMKSQVITGHLTGSPVDTEEAMRFALHHGVRPMVERMPLKDAGRAVARIRAGEARFRIVLDIGETDD
jgi:D-arabinose 1-dehydrogenase-like Zn-dependent alcohol dehydrogenase